MRNIFRAEQPLQIDPNTMVAIWPLQHFPFRFCNRPMLVNNAVHVDHQSGAVGTVIAMHEYRAVSLLALNQIKRRRNIFWPDAPSEQRLVE